MSIVVFLMWLNKILPSFSISRDFVRYNGGTEQCNNNSNNITEVECGMNRFGSKIIQL